MNFREQKEFKVFHELLRSVPGLEARLVESSEEEILLISYALPYNFVYVWLNPCHTDPERCKWGEGGRYEGHEGCHCRLDNPEGPKFKPTYSLQCKSWKGDQP